MGTRALPRSRQIRQHPQRPPPGAVQSIRERERARQPSRLVGSMLLRRTAARLVAVGAGALFAVGGQQRAEDVRDADASAGLVTQPPGKVHSIAITPTIFDALQIPGVHQLGDQGRGGAFGDSDDAGNVTQAQSWIPGEA